MEYVSAVPAAGGGRDQSPLGRTVQLLRTLHKVGMIERIADRESNRHSIGKGAFCLQELQRVTASHSGLGRLA